MPSIGAGQRGIEHAHTHGDASAATPQNAIEYSNGCGFSADANTDSLSK